MLRQPRRLEPSLRLDPNRLSTNSLGEALASSQNAFFDQYGGALVKECSEARGLMWSIGGHGCRGHVRATGTNAQMALGDFSRTEQPACCSQATRSHLNASTPGTNTQMRPGSLSRTEQPACCSQATRSHLISPGPLRSLGSLLVAAESETR